MTLRLAGSTSGYTEIDAPAVAGSNLITLPSGNGSANQFLKNGSTAGSLGWSSMVETATGVGIGTSTPASLLNVSGSSLGLAFQVTDTSATSGVGQKISNTTNALNIGINNSSGNAFNGGGAYGAVFDATGAYSMAFCTNSAERMRIDNTGVVMIGTTTTNPGDGNTTTGISFTSAGKFYLSQASDGGHMNRNSDGNVLSFRRSGSEVGRIAVTSSSTSYITSSDYRLKENVTEVTDGITRLQQLKPSRFNFIVDPGRTVDGFIAHEVQEVVPEAITGEKDAVDEDGKPIYQGIDQAKLVPLLTAALQEAIGRIESLEAANADLAARIAALEVTP